MIPGVIEESPNKVSCREYYCYKFQIRSSRQSRLLHARRLFYEFAVDQYIKLETTRLDFYRWKQNDMRFELYQGLVDSIMAGESRGSELGQRIILPASFIGGPGDMRRRYLDAMALVQRFGKPDLFITMICNHEWNEIQEELLPGQHGSMIAQI
ncbi:hypothetical protein LIER_40215 [Lithospermum erythrorhizon]|uniref:Helitron helicase-like domain-containing protein n=1 Tax=Lithospermum erythrorhizon TaxID=34254 RepID=A0AAV3QTL7_LITER